MSKNNIETSSNALWTVSRGEGGNLVQREKERNNALAVNWQPEWRPSGPTNGPTDTLLITFVSVWPSGQMGNALLQ